MQGTGGRIVRLSESIRIAGNHDGLGSRLLHGVCERFANASRSASNHNNLVIPAVHDVTVSLDRICVKMNQMFILDTNEASDYWLIFKLGIREFRQRVNRVIFQSMTPTELGRRAPFGCIEVSRSKGQRSL